MRMKPSYRNFNIMNSQEQMGVEVKKWRPVVIRNLPESYRAAKW